MSEVEPIRRLVVWRHTEFNTQASLTGEAAALVVKATLRRDDYDDWPLTEEGIRQAELLQQELKPVQIDAYLCSPTRRTRQTLEVALRGKQISGLVMRQLIERDRGMFAYMPDEWAFNHPLYKVGKESVRTWRPGGEDAEPRAETIEEVINRIDPDVLDAADALAPGGCVGICAHGETMASMRGVQRLGARNDTRFRTPLVKGCDPNTPLGKPYWIAQVQIDMYDRRSNTSPDMTHFKTLGYHAGQRFETDWTEIVRD